MPAEQKLVIQSSRQMPSRIDNDIIVDDSDLVEMYEQGNKVLKEIGEVVATRLNPLGPPEWVEEAIFGGPRANSLYRIGNCLVMNHFGPVGMKVKQEFIIIGKEDEAQDVLSNLRLHAPYKEPWRMYKGHEDHRAGISENRIELQLPEGVTLESIQTIQQLDEILRTNEEKARRRK